MRVLIITPNYYPDLGPSAPLYSMLSQGLVLRGHQVSVITAVPHYPSGIVPPKFKDKRIRHTNENNVDVTRVPLPSINRANLKNRLWQFFCFQLQATWASFAKDFDAVIVANPALQTWLPFTFDVVIKNRPAIFSVHDVYPDVGIQLGIFKKPYQIALVSWFERYCLRNAPRQDPI
jgi:colanic acid biosynthesis glycosyl transferase WcaI